MNDIAPSPSSSTPSLRLDYLDATRAFALLLGVVFHAALSFMPVFMGWAVQDVSTSPVVGTFVMLSHSFRMELFFLLAGFFACGAVQRRGAAAFAGSRLVRIGLPLVVGWFILRPLLVSGWLMGAESLRGDYHFWPSLLGGIRSLDTLPDGLFVGTHLWFLYYILLLSGLVLVGRGLAQLIPSFATAVTAFADRLLARCANAPWTLALLATLTALPLAHMKYWGMDTPDQSLIPHWPVLAVYGGGFVLGWFLGRQPKLITHLCRLRASTFALAAAGIWGTLLLQGHQLDLAHPRYVLLHALFSIAYSAMMWALVSLCIGAFEKLVRRPIAGVRYVADASYWLYLIHLPVVVWFQVAIAEVQWHWFTKLLLVSGSTISLGLVTYDLFVRSTWVGVLLNGVRRERVLFSRKGNSPSVLKPEAATTT